MAVLAVRATAAAIGDDGTALVAAGLQSDGATRWIIGHVEREAFVPVAVLGEAAVEADALMLLGGLARDDEHARADLGIVEPDVAEGRRAQGHDAGRHHKQRRKTHTRSPYAIDCPARPSGSVTTFVSRFQASSRIVPP
jgi:hypothetical protein